MPIGRNCRSCGAALPADLGWCTSCYTPVTLYPAREPMHQAGTLVGTPRPDVKTSRWRAGPTTMGPVGRIGWTVGLLLIFPWWALVIPLVSIWRKERVAPDAPATLMERFRARHPALGREVRVGPAARLAILVLAAVAVVAIFLTKDAVDRYLFAAPVLVVGLTIALASWNDLNDG
jgi:hypothetical protein